MPTEENIKLCVIQKLTEAAIENPEELMTRGGNAIVELFFQKAGL